MLVKNIILICTLKNSFPSPLRAPWSRGPWGRGLTGLHYGPPLPFLYNLQSLRQAIFRSSGKDCSVDYKKIKKQLIFIARASADYEMLSDSKKKIRRNYTFLRRQLDTVHSNLLDFLLADGVLEVNEKAEIDVLPLQTERCQKLMSILRCKTQKQFEMFLAALDASNQSHVATRLRLEGRSYLLVTNSIATTICLVK